MSPGGLLALRAWETVLPSLGLLPVLLPSKWSTVGLRNRVDLGKMTWQVTTKSRYPWEKHAQPATSWPRVQVSLGEAHATTHATTWWDLAEPFPWARLLQLRGADEETVGLRWFSSRKQCVIIMIRAYLRTVYKDALSAHLEIIPCAYLYVSVCICSQIRFFRKRLLNFLCQLLQGYANVGLNKKITFF